VWNGGEDERERPACPADPPSLSSPAVDAAHLTAAALESRASVGHTAPHPYSGAVLASADGRALAAGHARGAAGAAAAAAALAALPPGTGDALAGGTIYLNLEPLAGEGVGEALSRARVRRAVVGLPHPLPHARGRGVAELVHAGIDVVLLQLPEPGSPAAADAAAAAAALFAADPSASPPLTPVAAVLAANEALLHRAATGRPLGLLKYAMTLDGKIATSAGHSAWVSSPASRARVFAARAASDAVVVGGNTVRRDDPRLTTRAEGGHAPLRVVMSRTLDLPSDAALWDTEVAPTVVATQRGARPAARAALEAAGVEVLEFDFLTPGAVADWCAARGALQVLWECGGTLAAPALADRAIHKVLAFVAPKVVGGARAPTPVGELGFFEMTQALDLSAGAWRPSGPDILFSGYTPASAGPVALAAELAAGSETPARWPAGATSSAATARGGGGPPPAAAASGDNLAPPLPPLSFYKAWDALGELSNFSGHPIELPEGPVVRSAGGHHALPTPPPGPLLSWPTVEHYYQAQKFAGVPGAGALVASIRAAATAEEAARIGRAAARATPSLVRPDWDASKVSAMETALRSKFSSHPRAAAALAATRGRRLAEAAPSDYFWGVGVDGTGANHLGRLLERVRDGEGASGSVEPAAGAGARRGAGAVA
jgi:diaminohydroxyphosphoribosylaminopyrimidine deaminase/5-amino-6-(5-phosphoribosylamino)uracil reductase